MAKQNKKPEPRLTGAPMTLRSFVRNAEGVVAQQKANMAAKMQKGQLANMESYHRDVGRAEGMDMCIGLLKDMLGKIEDAQSHDDLPEMTG